MLKAWIKRMAERRGYRITRPGLPDNRRPDAPPRLDTGPEELDGLDRGTRQVLNLLGYAQGRETAYRAEGLPAGYHTLSIGGRRFAGQRDPGARLAQVPYEFAGKTVLDIGCNQGGMLFALAETIRHGVGIDIDARMVNAANRLRSVTGRGNLDFYVFDLAAERLDRILDLLPGGRADIAFLLSVCMWIPNWREVIDFCRRTAGALLFETNGTPAQQREQVDYLKSRYGSVQLLAERSEDDPLKKERMLYLCSAAGA